VKSCELANLPNLASSAVVHVYYYSFIIFTMNTKQPVPKLAENGMFTHLPSYHHSFNITNMTTKQPIPNMLRFLSKTGRITSSRCCRKAWFTSYDRISHWENGLAFPSVTNLFRLSALYNVPAQELYGEFFKTFETELSVADSPVKQD